MGVGGHDTIAFGRSSGISDERTAMPIVVERQGWFGENDVDCHGTQASEDKCHHETSQKAIAVLRRDDTLV